MNLAALNVLAVHDPDSDSFDGDCVKCHGSKEASAALHPDLPNAHAAMFAVAPYSGKTGSERCVMCHTKVDLEAGSGGDLRKQVSVKSCAPCHGPGSPFPYYKSF